MDSSEGGLDRIEAQRTTDVSGDQRKGIYFHMNLFYKSLLTLCSWGFSQSARDGATSPIEEPEWSELYNLPGETVAMKSEIVCAMRHGDIEIFLENMKSSNTPMACFKTDKGDSILHIAATFGHLELVKRIVSKCPSLLLEPNCNDQIPLHVAAGSGHSKVVKTLVTSFKSLSTRLAEDDRRRVNPYVLRDKNGDTPLHLVLKEHCAIYKPLLPHHIVHFPGPITFAHPYKFSYSGATKRLTDTAVCLVDLDNCASFLANKNGETPLYLAVEAGNISLVKSMLNHSGNGKTSESASQSLQLEGKKSLVHAALKSENIDVLDIILKHFPSLANERDEEGRTCLSVAASVGFHKGLCMLLDKKLSSIFECDNDGSYPIHMAVEKGHKDVFKELLKRCPNSVDQLNKKGQNIYHISATSGKARLILLCDIVGYKTKNRLIEEQDVDGNTPVHLATINWRPRTLFRLFNFYSRSIKVLNIQNTLGFKPLDIAEKHLQPEYVFRERMTLMVLLSLYKPRRLAWVPTSGITLRSRSEKVVGGGGKYKDLIQVLLVVATLVATMTFAAGFTIPGGFNSSAPKPGMAILADSLDLTKFLLFDAMAMYSSIIAIVALIWAQLGDQKLADRAFNLALPFLFIALTFMSAAFYFGVDTTIKHNRMLRNSLFSLFVIFSLGTTFLLTPYVIPQISGVPVIKEVTSLYLFVLLMFVNEADDEKHCNGHTVCGEGGVAESGKVENDGKHCSGRTVCGEGRVTGSGKVESALKL